MCSCWDELTQTAEKRNGYNHMITFSHEKYHTNVNNRHFTWENDLTPISGHMAIKVGC